jgi:hypothetical protein
MSLTFFYSMCLVVLGGELAVPYTRNPLYAGLNPPRRVFHSCPETILTGRHATGGHEPRQVRKEAAISDSGCVVDRSRLCLWFLLPKENSTGGAQPLPPPFPVSGLKCAAPPQFFTISGNGVLDIEINGLIFLSNISGGRWCCCFFWFS